MAKAQPVPLVEVYAELRKACAVAGGQDKWAKWAGVSPQFLCDVLHTRREPTDRILKPLGMRRRTVYEREIAG